MTPRTGTFFSPSTRMRTALRIVPYDSPKR